MKNFYLLDKKEIKEELKKFNKTQIGKTLNIMCIGTIIVSFIFLLNMFLGIAFEIISNTDDEILNILNSIDSSIYCIELLLTFIVASILYTSYLKFFKDYYIKKDS